MPRKPNESPKARWLPNQNRWQIKVQKDGIRKTFTCTTVGRKGKYECEEKAQAWLRNETHNATTQCSVLLAAYLKELESMSGGTSGTGHYRNYKGLINCYLLPKLAKKRICDLTEGVLQDIITSAYKERNLSKKTLENVRACIRAYVKWCRMHGYTTLFPENLKIPRGASVKEKTILYPADIKLLFERDATCFGGKIMPDWYINAYRFAASVGLRPGELVGLRRDDYNKGVLRIKQSINEAGETTAGKNANACRTIYLSTFQQAIWDAQMAMLRQYNLVSPWAFPSRKGDATKQKILYRAWGRYTAHNELQKTSLYELRHTFVSVFGEDLPDNLVKRVVGHSKAMPTRGTYGHALPDEDIKIMGLMEQKFAEIMRGENP